MRIITSVLIGLLLGAAAILNYNLSPKQKVSIDPKYKHLVHFAESAGY